jgi:hypothetical protein
LPPPALYPSATPGEDLFFGQGMAFDHGGAGS